MASASLEGSSLKSRIKSLAERSVLRTCSTGMSLVFAWDQVPKTSDTGNDGEVGESRPFPLLFIMTEDCKHGDLCYISAELSTC